MVLTKAMEKFFFIKSKYRDIIYTVIGIAVIIIAGRYIARLLNDTLLVENRISIYNESLAWGKYDEYHIPLSSEDHSEAYNYVTYKLYNIDRNGVSFMMDENLSIILDGKNDIEDDFDIYIGDLQLPDGRYVLSDGLDDPERGYLYVWGDESAQVEASTERERAKQRRTDGDESAQVETFAEPEGGSDVLVVDNSKTTYHVAFHVYEGAEFVDQPVSPMIRPEEVKDDTYVPGRIRVDRTMSTSDEIRYADYDKIRIIHMSEEAYNGMSETDRKYFENHIQYACGDNYKWVTVDFGDGTGIQFVHCDTDDVRQGKLDQWGRVV